MPVRTEVDGEVGLVLLDRPDKAHAYDREHLDLLAAGFAAVAARVRVVVLGSTGDRAFCAGADLDQMRGADPLEALDLRSQQVFTDIAAAPVVTIAAIQGPAVAGGFELALACDLRVVGPRAVLSLPETALGIIPSAGGCTRLTRLVGPARAKEVILAGRKLDARTALDWGLATELAPDPLAAARRHAADVARRDPVALRLAKQIIDRGEDPASLEAERVSEALLYARRKLNEPGR